MKVLGPLTQMILVGAKVCTGMQALDSVLFHKGFKACRTLAVGNAENVRLCQDQSTG